MERETAVLDLTSSHADAPPSGVDATTFWTLGIDPGVKGAIVGLRGDLEEHRIRKMPIVAKQVSPLEVVAFIRELRAVAPVRLAVVERAQPMPKQGGVGNFSYGRNYGILLAVLEIEQVPFLEITSSNWKLAIIGKASRDSDKNAIKDLAFQTARRLFPKAGPFKKTEDGPAEALLIAEAARRIALKGDMKAGG